MGTTKLSWYVFPGKESKMEVKDLYVALKQKVGFSVVGETFTDVQLRVIGRIPPTGTGTWLQVLESLLIASEQAPWDIDASKQYFLRDGSIRYAWRLIFQVGAEDVVQNHIQTFVNIVHGVNNVQTQIMEVSLHGNPNRNSLKRGKGAQEAGKAVVGPMALHHMNQGG